MAPPRLGFSSPRPWRAAPRRPSWRPPGRDSDVAWERWKREIILYIKIIKMDCISYVHNYTYVYYKMVNSKSALHFTCRSFTVRRQSQFVVRYSVPIAEQFGKWGNIVCRHMCKCICTYVYRESGKERDKKRGSLHNDSKTSLCRPLKLDDYDW